MRKSVVIAFAACVAVLPCIAGAQTITLKIADILPATHYISRDALAFWMDEVTKSLGDRIKFQYYPAEQLGKARDMYTLLRSGAVDMAYIAPSYLPEKFPLTSVAELPRMTNNSCDGSHAYWAMMHGGVLEQREFAPQGLVPIIGIMLAPSQLQGRGTPHDPPTNLAGLKVRGGGAAVELTIRTLGGVPIQLPGPDVRQGLERGTIDAIIGPSPSAVQYDHVPFLNYVTTNANLTGFGTTYTMSANRWKSLPAEVQATMLQAADAAIAHFCQAEDKLEADSLKVMESKNIQPIALDAAQVKQLDTQLAPIHDRWAADMNARGLPGKEAMAAFTAAVAKAQ